MMNDGLFFSIIMPVFNSGNYLETAVSSILSQDFRLFELILVDDGSTDGSSEACDRFAKEDARVVVIHQKNGGICNARNNAIKVAKGKYIGFADHDDEYLPGYLKSAYERALEYDADLIKVGKKEFVLKQNKILRTKQSCLSDKVYYKDDIKSEYFSLVNSDELDCVWDGLFKRSIVSSNQIRYDEALKKGGEDIDFIQRYLIHVNTFVTIGHIYYNHYIRTGFSTSSKFNLSKVDSLDQIIASMIQTINVLKIDIQHYQFEYTYHLLRQYIAPICAIYSSNECTLSDKEIKDRLLSIKSMDFYHSFCDKQSVLKFYRLSPKYALLYFFFKKNLFRMAINIYKFRALHL
jgi:glycosyltransferase involved in cell wall biosynthesis